MSINRRELFNRIISVTLIYVLFLQDFIPGVRAYQLIDVSRNVYSGNYFGAIEFSDNIPIKEDDFVLEKEVLELTKVVSLPSAPMPPISTGGPGQNEIVGSTANVGNNLVNTFTGDLNYSIPLMDVEGFPIVLSYDPNISMDQEASWVGLGWNLSLGSINREMRGIPDDFSGDEIDHTIKMRDHTVSGKDGSLDVMAGIGDPLIMAKTGFDTEEGIAAIKANDNPASISLSYSFRFSRGKYLDNYTGEGRRRSADYYGSIGLGLGYNDGVNSGGVGVGISGGIGFSHDSQNGIGKSYTSGFNSSASIGSGPVEFGIDYTNQRTINANSRSGILIVNNSSGFSFNLGLKSLSSGMPLGGIGASISKGSLRTFGAQSFVPRFSSPNRGIATYNGRHINFTAVYLLLYGGFGFGGSTNDSQNTVAKYTVSYPSFGYMNHSKGQNNNNALLDFNRGQNTQVNTETKMLSFSAQTYDIFYCSAPGIASSFRPFRYDVVEYHDPEISSFTETRGEISEKNISGGINVTGGATFGKIETEQQALGMSDQATGTGGLIQYFKGINKSQTYNSEEYYFKTQGENCIQDFDMLSLYGNENPSFLNIEENNGNIVLDGDLITGNQGDDLPSQNFSLKRPDASVYYKEATYGEMSQPTIYNEIDCDNPGLTINNGVKFNTIDKKNHHIGSIEVISDNGMRYVFGIPVYSYNQSEVSFSVSGRLDESDYARTGLVKYQAGDNSVLNNLGRTQVYEKSNTPAFVTSYLLTEMLSPDYVDLTGDGVSPDDAGNYYKLNYSSPYEGDGDKDDIWKWRLPMCSGLNTPPSGLGVEYSNNLAYANKNLHADKWDDMANYLYGEKEVWYAASVESKNLIAFFCLEDREDQFSMIDENGGLDITKPGKKLDKITIYSKNELEQKGASAKPLKVIKFDYDYNLCQKYVGNINTYSGTYGRSGKLTLKRIYIYSGNSEEGKTVPIEFEYSLNNPDFAFNSSDRWGNYKPNNVQLPNHEFPYSDQEYVNANSNIQAWKLTAVNIVAGARTEFSYEPDSYSNVQNKRAMRMFQVAGMSSTDELNAVCSSTSGSVIASDPDLLYINSGKHVYFRNPIKDKDHYNVIYFKLDEPINVLEGDPADIVRRRYLEDEDGIVPDEMYFKMYARLDNHALDDTEERGYEYVESVAKLGKLFNNQIYYGVAGLPDANSDYHYGWFIIEPEDIRQHDDLKVGEFNNYFNAILSNFLTNLFNELLSYKVNPLQVTNWQFGRLISPCAVYGDIDYLATSPDQFCDYHLNNDGNIFGGNLYKKLNKKEYGIKFNPEKSIVRLHEPDNIKYGGGYRVIAVVTTDNWNDYSNESDASYNYTFDFDSREKTNGVASYEPNVGNNENPFYEFETYDIKRNLLPDERVYQKNPWGELVFPGPIVGYEEVTSKLNSGVKSGKITETYYTLKDYPTIAKKTNIKSVRRSGSMAIKSNGYAKELFGYSQGFYVETSDFHGKPKETIVYGEGGNVISSTEIEYYDFDNDIMQYIDREGNIIPSSAPRDIDIHTDSWRSTSSSTEIRMGNTKSIGANQVGPSPSIIFIPYFDQKFGLDLFSYSNAAYAFTFNKIVHNYAIPKRINTSYLGSQNSAENLFFDKASGSVIVSSLKDEFDDELYSMSYPAHWYYENFREMCENDGLVMTYGISEFQSGAIICNAKLYEGDRLRISDANGEYLGWVLKQEHVPWYELECGRELYHLVDANGDKLTGINWANSKVVVERTGVKNLLNIPMMNIVTKKFPVQYGTEFVFPEEGIITVSASEFDENHNVPCVMFGDEQNASSYPVQFLPGDTINPFLRGVKGNLRLVSSYAYQDDRDVPYGDGIRNNSVLKNYEPFYSLTNCGWRKISETDHPDNISAGDYNKYRSLGKITKFDEFGKPIQITDQINVNATSVYGMNNDLKLVSKANATNAKSTEIGFDGFEDYHYFQNNLIGYKNYGFSLYSSSAGQLVSDVRHSGRYSLMVEDEESFSFPTEYFSPVLDNIIEGQYEIQECDCIQGFAPTRGKEYFISTWVHENTRIYPFTGTEVQVEFLNGSGNPIGSNSFTPAGAVIDGWQKVEGSFVIPVNSVSIRIRLISSGESYFDDFRFQPLLAAMTTIVYDQNTLLPIATHDGYNYTTFYNYNKNNEVVRIRVETVEGIKTISESETGSFRKH